MSHGDHRRSRASCLVIIDRDGTCLRYYKGLLEMPKHCLWICQSTRRMLQDRAPNLDIMLGDPFAVYLLAEGDRYFPHPEQLSSLLVIHEDSHNGDKIWSILSSIHIICSQVIGGENTFHAFSCEHLK